MASSRKLKQRRRTKPGVLSGSPEARERRSQTDAKKKGERTTRKRRDVSYAGAKRRVAKNPRAKKVTRRPGSRAPAPYRAEVESRAGQTLAMARTRSTKYASGILRGGQTGDRTAEGKSPTRGKRGQTPKA